MPRWSERHHFTIFEFLMGKFNHVSKVRQVFEASPSSFLLHPHPLQAGEIIQSLALNSERDSAFGFQRLIITTTPPTTVCREPETVPIHQHILKAPFHHLLRLDIEDLSLLFEFDSLSPGSPILQLPHSAPLTVLPHPEEDALRESHQRGSESLQPP